MKIDAFPSDDSAMSSAGFIMLDINEECVQGRKYINMGEINSALGYLQVTENNVHHPNT